MSGDHDHDPGGAEQALRAEALESLLVEKGMIASEQIDGVVDRFESDVGPMVGARAVARAWVDPDYRARLLADGSSALAELGVVVGDLDRNLRVVANTPRIHNVIVCTLCSCYPWSVLGLPPAWYKAPAYRSRVVREPRAVLEEFGVELGDEVEVRVWDSSAEVRYMVLPERPAGSEGLGEEQLAGLVGRDAMIGTALAGASQ
jgi:nitrile hydratase